MKCPHCGAEIERITGPNCPKCKEPIFGREAKREEPEEAIPGVKVKDLDQAEKLSTRASDAAAQELEQVLKPAAPAEEAEEEEEEVQVSDFGRVDLDAVEAGETEAAIKAAEEAGRIDPTVFLTQEQIEQRHRAQLLEQAAIEAHVATIAWGAYIGAAIGAAVGYFAGEWAHKLVQTGVGALVGAIVGYLVGQALSWRVEEATRRERGARAIIVISTIFIVAAAFTPLVWAFIWGVKNYLLWTVAVYLVVGFAFFTWVYQDATYRQAEHSLRWGLIAWIFPPATAAYLVRRPQGELVVCGNPKCEKKYLARLDRCPHCGFRSEAHMRRLEL